MSEATLIAPLDLDACAAEPIRIPGGVQPHGALLCLDPQAGRILQVSSNIEDILGVPLAAGGSVETLPELKALLPQLAALSARTPPLMRTLSIAGRPVQLGAHATEQGVIVEFEPPPGPGEATLDVLYPRLQSFMDQIGGAAEVTDIARAAVREIRELTGFNRVLLYSFDEEGVGTVLAEDGDGVLPSYLNLRFPAADIPAQARELYKLSRIRLIVSSDYRPAPIVPTLNPVDGQPLDLGRAALRSVSPVHLEYMRNMGTGASMSISIMVEGELWGLVSAHNREPRLLSAQIRSACDHLGQVLSLQIEAREQARRTSESLRLSNIQAELLARLAAAPNFATGLESNPDFWLAVGGGAGAALVNDEQLIAVGLTPGEAAIRSIAARLFAEDRAEIALESMAAEWPDAVEFADIASGLLAVSISQIHPNYLMWFRPEAVRTVAWAGEPAKAVEIGERLHPRKSFELWKEQVRLRALPWTPEEAASAHRFRSAIQDFVLRRAEERAELTGQLSKINQELESFSYSISHDLRAPFRHVVGFAELLSEHAKSNLDETARHYLQSIKEAGLSAGRLVDDLLNFSQLGRNSLSPARVDMNRLVTEVIRSLRTGADPQDVEWRIDKLPSAWGDPAMIRQALQNLIGNALKYSAGRTPAVIQITGSDADHNTSYTVTDNGVGFDMAYAHKLFSVFERLHRADEFEGTGIGLALVRRIVERHGGEVSASGEPGAGASFTFTLPKRAKDAPGDTLLG